MLDIMIGAVKKITGLWIRAERSPDPVTNHEEKNGYYPIPKKKSQRQNIRFIIADNIRNIKQHFDGYRFERIFGFSESLEPCPSPLPEVF